MKLTEDQIRDAFCATNTEEPLCGGWPGLLRFARMVELLVTVKMEQEAPQQAINVPVGSLLYKEHQ